MIPSEEIIAHRLAFVLERAGLPASVAVRQVNALLGDYAVVARAIVPESLRVNIHFCTGAYRVELCCDYAVNATAIGLFGVTL